MQNLNNFLLISNSIVAERSLINLDEYFSSNYLPVYYKDHFCLYHGLIHNSAELFGLAGSGPETIESVLTELYLREPQKFPSLIKGYFSLVIGNKDIIYLLRDGNGFENIYYYDNPQEKEKILISNSIKEIAKYTKLELNSDILPDYFLKTDINSGATFFKNVRTLSFFEHCIINRNDYTRKYESFEGFFKQSKTENHVNVKDLINDTDNLLADTINEKCNQLNSGFRIINSLSGGTDSSLIQFYLKRNNSNIAYTANFTKAGLDHLYASDVAGLMELEQKTIQCDTNELISVAREGIWLSEKPFMFAGESLLLRMYQEIAKDQQVPVACFDGTGAEGIFGASKILYELRIIRKFHFLFGLVLPLFRFYSEKVYKRYKEFHKYSNSKTIPENFILRYFTDENMRNTVMEAFGLPDLNNIDDYEITMMRRYDTILFESVYRFLAFELEYKRVNNTRLQIAKKYNITLVFPFTETSIFKYLLRFDSEIKLRNAKTKYIFRKVMEKYFPKSIIYRKKVRKNVSVSDEILKNENVKTLITEIKNRKYPYFNFNYDEVFRDPKYSTLAYKLINFHLWHKIFIDSPVIGPAESGSPQRSDNQ